MVADGDALLGRAEDAVRRALQAGAAQAEVYLTEGAGLDLDIEGGALAAGSLARSAGGSVRLVKDGRIGFAYFVRDADLPAAIDQALSLSRLAPRLDFTLPAGGRPPGLAGRWDETVAGLDAGHAVALAGDLLQGAAEACPDGTVTGGGVGLAWGLEALASSEGAAAWDRNTHCSAAASLTVGDGDTAVSAWDHEESHRLDLDGHAVGAAVGRTVASLRGPQAAKAGPADIVFLPDAASELVLGLVGSAVDGDTAMRGKSVWSGHLGEAVAHEGLHLWDRPRHPGGLGTVPFDGDGLATRDVPVLDGGVLRSYLFDAFDAHRHQKETTRNAVRSGFKSPPGVGAHHWVLWHDSALALDDLVGGVDHGYLVESVLGAHTANATTGDFSVTAPNVWRIEDGSLAGASREVAIGGNLPGLLGRLDAVSDAPRRRDGALVPALRFRDVHVSV